MNQGRYFAADSPVDFERERLNLLRYLTDPITIRRLTQLGIRRGGRCLDVGAGDGGVARWMAEQVGPEGHVTATDIDPRLLVGSESSNIEISRHDISMDDLEASHYDLVHCRLVLMHLADPLRALERMVASVRPGGWLIVEEFDHCSFGASDPGHPSSAEFLRRSRAAFAGLHTGRIMDFTLGRRLRDLVERLALADTGHDGVTQVNRGADPGARFFWTSLAVVRDRLIAGGWLTEEDLAGLRGISEDKSFYFIGMTLFGAWGRRVG